jgi:hypothetical protein
VTGQLKLHPFHSFCLQYSQDDQVQSQLPLYRDIMQAAPKLRILIYTGQGSCGCIAVLSRMTNLLVILSSCCTGFAIDKDLACMCASPMSGDADGLVPLTGTRKWVFELGTEEGKKKKTHWRHWEDEAGQVRCGAQQGAKAGPRCLVPVCPALSPPACFSKPLPVTPGGRLPGRVPGL